MPTLRSIEQAKQAIALHIDRQFGYVPPSTGSARQILHRPFPSNGDEHIMQADGVLYSCRDGQQTRMALLLAAIRARTDIEVSLDSSLYTTYGNEKAKEELGGLDSAVALAVVFAGADAWLTISNYHLYEHRHGRNEVARILGQKVLGPSMILTRRPATDMTYANTAAKHFPDSIVGAEFNWIPVIDVHPEILELETGVAISELKKQTT